MRPLCMSCNTIIEKGNIKDNGYGVVCSNCVQDRVELIEHLRKKGELTEIKLQELKHKWYPPKV